MLKLLPSKRKERYQNDSLILTMNPVLIFL
jgi:hypothetical protein